MKQRTVGVTVLMLLGLAVVATGQDIKKYPGARIDKAATEEARLMAAAEPGLEVTVYTATDAFEKVHAFYKQNAHEYNMPGKRVRKLPSGQELRDAFFLLDDAKDLQTSKAWVKIQRPYIGNGISKEAGGAGVKDVTAVIISQRK